MDRETGTGLDRDSYPGTNLSFHNDLEATAYGENGKRIGQQVRNEGGGG